MSEDYTQVSDHMSVLRRRGWIIVLLAVLGAVVGGLFATVQSPTYTATAVVLAPPAPAGVDTTEYVATQAQVVESDQVVSNVISRLGLDAGSRELIDAITVEVVESTTTLSISATDSSRTEAADLANAFADSYLYLSSSRREEAATSRASSFEQDLADANAKLLTLRRQSDGLSGDADIENRLEIARVRQLRDRLNTALTQTQDPAVSSGEGRVLRQAGEQGAGSSQVLRSALFGLVLGLILGTVLAYARHHLDDRLYTEDDLLEAVPEIPVLARIASNPAAGTGGSDLGDGPSGGEGDRPGTEGYRTLATNLRFRLGLSESASPSPNGAGAAVDRTGAGAAVVAITSPRSGEGKTSVAVNLAIRAAANGLRVVLADAHLRDPQVASYFGLEDDRDGSEAMTRPHGSQQAVARRDVGVGNLDVVTAGSREGGSWAALTSPRTSPSWQSLGEGADLVLLDTAPVLDAPETLDVASRADRVLLVVESGRSRARDLKAATRSLDLVGVQVAGIVLNRVPDRSVARRDRVRGERSEGQSFLQRALR